MAVELFSGPRIAGCGMYVPEYVLTNEILIKNTGINSTDEWIRDNVGIKERHILRDRNKATSDMAIEAMKAALEDADMKAKKLDGIIVPTVTGDFGTLPAAANIIQAALGINGFAFDIVAGCSGLVHGMIVAKALLESGNAKRVGVIGAETLSRFVDWSKRETCVLFGDGAVALIMELSDSPVMRMSYDWVSKGDPSLLSTPARGSAEPPSIPALNEGRQYIHMDGRAVGRMAVREMSESMHVTMDKAGSELSSYKAIIPHQANLHIIENLARREKLDPKDHIVFLSKTGTPLKYIEPSGEQSEKITPEILVNVDRFGNTSAASIGLALVEADARGRQIMEFERKSKFDPHLWGKKVDERGAIRDNDRLLLVTVGAGPARASIDLKWKENEDGTTPKKLYGRARRIFNIPFSFIRYLVERPKVQEGKIQ